MDFPSKIAIVADFHRSSGELVSHNAASGKSTACFSGIFCVCVVLCNKKPCDTPNRNARHRVFKNKNIKPENGISRGVLTWWLTQERCITCNRKEIIRKTEEYKCNRHIAVTWVELCVIGFNTGICIRIWIDKF